MNLPGFSADASLAEGLRALYGRSGPGGEVTAQAMPLEFLKPGCDDPSNPGCGGGGVASPVNPFLSKGPGSQMPGPQRCLPWCSPCEEGKRVCINAKCATREVSC